MKQPKRERKERSCRADLNRHVRDGFDRVLFCVKTWRDRRDEKSLHDLRVALRQFRFLFRLFKKPLSGLATEDLVKRLRGFGRRLGEVRDLDVVLAIADDEGAPAQVMAMIRKKRGAALRRALHDAERSTWASLRPDVKRLMVAMGKCKGDDVSLRTYCERQVRRQLRRVLRAAAMATSKDAEVLHAFRVKLRRLRYIGDVAGSQVDARYSNLMAQVHDIEQLLGRVHDIDVAIAFLAKQRRVEVSALGAALRKRRSRLRAKFLKKWTKVEVKLKNR